MINPLFALSSWSFLWWPNLKFFLFRLCLFSIALVSLKSEGELLLIYFSTYRSSRREATLSLQPRLPPVLPLLFFPSLRFAFSYLLMWTRAEIIEVLIFLCFFSLLKFHIRQLLDMIHLSISRAILHLLSIGLGEIEYLLKLL